MFCLSGCHSTNRKQFSSLSDVKQALRTVNIDLVNNRQDSSGVQRGNVTIGGLDFSLQFPWPLDNNGTLKLPSNHNLPVPGIRDFTGKLTHQVGINGSLPPLQLVGLGNFGFSIETFVISFNEEKPSSIEMIFNIPGWDALNKFQFKVMQPKLNIEMSFLNLVFNARAKGFMASINQGDPRSSNKGLPIELAFPENQREYLEISIADEYAIIEFNSLVPMLSARMDKNTLEAISDISQNITVPKLNLRLSAGLSNISIINMTTVSTRPFPVLGKMDMNNATLELTEKGNAFQVAIYICQGQQLLVNMRSETSQYLILESAREGNHRNASISIEDFLLCFEEITERRPDINFMRMNVSSYEFRLQHFQIIYKLKPKLQLAKIGILVALPREWNVFNRASVPTKLLNSTLSVQTTVAQNSSLAETKAEVFGQVVIGHPPLIDFPFVIEIPTRASPLLLSLQDTKTIKVDFKNLSKLGTLSGAFPSFLKSILTDLLVKKLKLQYSYNLSGSFKITWLEMEFPPNTTWSFPFSYLGDMQILHSSNHTLVSGQIIFGNVSLPCHLQWPQKSEGPMIELSKSLEIKGVSSFIKNIYRAFYGSVNIQDISSGLKRTKLSTVSGLSLEKTLFHLSSNLSLSRVIFTGDLWKYSWELLGDFFGVTDTFISIDIDVGKSFVMFIRGTIVLVDGSANIPFEMKVHSSRNQSLTINLPEYHNLRISFKKLNGILTSDVKRKFPTVLGSCLPELVLQKQEISFNEKLTEFEINAFRAIRSTSWDLGGIGALTISNVTVLMEHRCVTFVWKINPSWRADANFRHHWKRSTLAT